MKRSFKSLIAVSASVAALILVIAASPTDSSVRGWLRGLVDTTASPPPTCQATNGVFSTLAASTARTTNSFLGTNTSLQIITDAKGLVTGITIVP